MDNLKNKIIHILDICNPFNVGQLTKDIKTNTDNILAKLDEEDIQISRLQDSLKKTRKERDYYQQLIKHIGQTIPDMMWYKDTEGNYKYINKAIQEELFYGLPEEEILNHNDIEISTKCKQLVGNENHTFGEICGNSDKEILKILRKQKFLEYGVVNGEDIYLEVHKAPIYDLEGNLIGTVGTGRNITELYVNLTTALNNDCSDIHCKEKIIDTLNLYKFEA